MAIERAHKIYCSGATHLKQRAAQVAAERAGAAAAPAGSQPPQLSVEEQRAEIAAERFFVTQIVEFITFWNKTDKRSEQVRGAQAACSRTSM